MRIIHDANEFLGTLFRTRCHMYRSFPLKKWASPSGNRFNYWRYLQYIRPMFQGYVRGDIPTLYGFNVLLWLQYLYCRILKFPLTMTQVSNAALMRALMIPTSCLASRRNLRPQFLNFLGVFQWITFTENDDIGAPFCNVSENAVFLVYHVWSSILETLNTFLCIM